MLKKKTGNYFIFYFLPQSSCGEICWYSNKKQGRPARRKIGFSGRIQWLILRVDCSFRGWDRIGKLYAKPIKSTWKLIHLRRYLWLCLILIKTVEMLKSPQRFSFLFFSFLWFGLFFCRLKPNQDPLSDLYPVLPNACFDKCLQHF